MERFVKPFGSLKKFVILLGVFLLSRFIDLLLTYYGLEAWEWDFDRERALIAQILMKWLGFFPAAIVGTTLLAILVIVGAYLIFSFTARRVGVTRARRGTTTLVLWASAMGPFCGASNMEFLLPSSRIKVLFHEFLVFIATPLAPGVDIRLVLIIVSAVLTIGAVLMWPSPKRPT